uniref:C2H2-type domain-containing protein n=1 Tax=Lygus hesperus TaxID=30085 RepID=A0A0A9YM09_LYGHE
MVLQYTCSLIVEQSTGVSGFTATTNVTVLDTTIHTLFHQLLHALSTARTGDVCVEGAVLQYQLSPDTASSVSSPTTLPSTNRTCQRGTALLHGTADVGTGADATASTSADANAHIKHKKYVCKVCFKTFSQRGGLHIHNRIHLGQRPYKCPQCDKAFSQACNLKRHLRSHTGERPFQCDICLKYFNRKFSLIKHRQVQHSGR